MANGEDHWKAINTINKEMSKIAVKIGVQGNEIKQLLNKNTEQDMITKDMNDTLKTVSENITQIALIQKENIEKTKRQQGLLYTIVGSVIVAIIVTVVKEFI